MMAVGKGSAALGADWTVTDTRSLTLATLTEAFTTATRPHALEERSEGSGDEPTHPVPPVTSSDLTAEARRVRLT